MDPTPSHAHGWGTKPPFERVAAKGDTPKTVPKNAVIKGCRNFWVWRQVGVGEGRIEPLRSGDGGELGALLTRKIHQSVCNPAPKPPKKVLGSKNGQETFSLNQREVTILP